MRLLFVLMLCVGFVLTLTGMVSATANGVDVRRLSMSEMQSVRGAGCLTDCKDVAGSGKACTDCINEDKKVDGVTYHSYHCETGDNDNARQCSTSSAATICGMTGTFNCGNDNSTHYYLNEDCEGVDPDKITNDGCSIPTAEGDEC